MNPLVKQVDTLVVTIDNNEQQRTLDRLSPTTTGTTSDEWSEINTANISWGQISQSASEAIPVMGPLPSQSSEDDLNLNFVFTPENEIDFACIRRAKSPSRGLSSR